MTIARRWIDERLALLARAYGDPYAKRYSSSEWARFTVYETDCWREK